MRPQNQAEHHKHSVSSVEAPREVSVAKQETVCNVCLSDNSIQHRKQKKNLSDYSTTRLSLKVPEHDRSAARRHNIDFSEPFPISKRVKQGCVHAPTHFTIFFSMMLRLRKILMMGTKTELDTFLLDT